MFPRQSWRRDLGKTMLDGLEQSLGTTDGRRGGREERLARTNGQTMTARYGSTTTAGAFSPSSPACDLLLTVMHAWVDAITMPCVVLSVRPTLLLPKPWGCPVVIAKSASRQAIAQGQPETDELGCAFTTQQSRQTQRSL